MRRAADPQSSARRWLVVFTVSMTLAALFYELLVVMSALVALYLFCGVSPTEDSLADRGGAYPGVIFTGPTCARSCARRDCSSWIMPGMGAGGDLIIEESVVQCWPGCAHALSLELCLRHVPLRSEQSGLAQGSDASESMVYWVIFARFLLLFGLWRTFNRLT